MYPYSYTVTIGRNFSGEIAGTVQPLPDVAWATFEDEVSELLTSERTTTADAIEIHRGKGVWEGVEEESSKITLLTHFRLGVNAEGRVRAGLSVLADTYQQDAIAFTVGQSDLIASATPAAV